MNLSRHEQSQLSNTHRLAGVRLAEIVFDKHPDGDAPERFIDEVLRCAAPRVREFVTSIGGDSADRGTALLIVQNELLAHYRQLVGNTKHANCGGPF